MKYSIVLLVAALSAVSAQIYLQQPIAYALQQPAPVQQSHAHPAVIRNAQAESEWPTELLKSHRFYSNPNTAAALAKSSWFTNEEMPVANREAEKIPRESIFKIINSAGLHRRRWRVSVAIKDECDCDKLMHECNLFLVNKNKL